MKMGNFSSMERVNLKKKGGEGDCFQTLNQEKEAALRPRPAFQAANSSVGGGRGKKRGRNSSILQHYRKKEGDEIFPEYFFSLNLPRRER